MTLGELEALADNPKIREESLRLATEVQQLMIRERAGGMPGVNALLWNLGGVLMEMNHGERPALDTRDAEKLSVYIRKYAERHRITNAQVADSLLEMLVTLFRVQYIQWWVSRQPTIIELEDDDLEDL